jgi:hypothetical protein
LAAIGAAVLLIGSCDLLGGGTDPVSIEKRTQNFEDGLNSDDRSDLYEEFHPDAQNYSSIKAASYWDDSTFFTQDYQPFSISSTTTSAAASDGTKTVNGTLSYTTGAGSISKDIVFTMKLGDESTDTAEVWYIYKIEVDGTLIIRKPSSL